MSCYDGEEGVPMKVFTDLDLIHTPASICNLGKVAIKIDDLWKNLNVVLTFPSLCREKRNH